MNDALARLIVETVARFKEEHPGVLEKLTEERKRGIEHGTQGKPARH